jgi:hypothetical protein
LTSLSAEQAALQPLVGLRLSIARNAAGMRIFHFGAIRPHRTGKGTVGAYALHLQCPWRIVGPDGIVTGSSDHNEPPTQGAEIDRNDPKAGTLQNVRLAALLGGYDSEARSHINATDALVVTAAAADPFGSVDISFTGDVRLQVFPDGSDGECWRFFEPSSDKAHFVVDGGRIALE